MERVGLDLQKTALRLKRDQRGFDLFGRSAFNRYYYATYLRVRGLILEFNPDWSGGHASVPDILTGSVTKEIKSFRSKMMKSGDPKSIEVCSKGVSSAAALAELMRRARLVRNSADYHPEEPVVREDGKRFSLANTSVTDAHSWIGLSERFIDDILRAIRLSRGIT